MQTGSRNTQKEGANENPLHEMPAASTAVQAYLAFSPWGLWETIEINLTL